MKSALPIKSVSPAGASLSTSRRAWGVALGLGLAGLGLTRLARAQSFADTARVAAAANLQPALTELAALFEGGQRGKPVITYGSSANLLRQIQQGLPAELFLSADEDFALRLADAGLTLDRGAVYATGRLALLVPAASSLVLDAGLDGLRAGLGKIGRVASANPELAPYGRAAVEALQRTGLWPQLSGKIVTGENIAQTTQYVSSGAADAGLTALSLALAPEVAVRTRHVVVDAALHAPLRQRMVLLKNAGPVARAFYDFILSPDARTVLQRHGYV